MKRELTISATHRMKGNHKQQDAVFYFVNGEFTRCEFHVSNLHYTLEDWKFLREVADEILRQKAIEGERYMRMVAADK